MAVDRASLAELFSFLETFPEPHILCDRDYRIIAANAAYRRSWPEARSVIGRTCYDVSHHYSVPCDRAGESCPLARSLQSGQRERVLHLHHTPAGEAYVNIELVPLRGADGEAAFFIERMEPLRVALGEPSSSGLIGRSPAFQQMLQLVARVGPSQASVLLLGESGTGKELVARAIHEVSPRAGQSFVAVNCGAIPEALLEAEFFGYRKGAFTGANEDRDGFFQAAHGGTLFLDEIGELPLSMQSKLLRVIQERAVRPLGSTAELPVNVRIVSATHKDLATEVAASRFRQDLYYRLNVIPIRLPSLRERGEDVRALALHFVNRANQAHQRNVNLAPDALARLEAHDWPGNIRQLRNNVERLMILTRGDQDAVITADLLPAEIGSMLPALPTTTGGEHLMSLPLRDAREIFEREYLVAQINRFGGNISRTASFVGMERSALHRKLKSLGVNTAALSGGRNGRDD